jgi:16S rRNA (cytosine967-C5)-methyltransferase
MKNTSKKSSASYGSSKRLAGEKKYAKAKNAKPNEPINPQGQKNYSHAKALPQHVFHLEHIVPELLLFNQPADRVVSRYFRANPKLGNRDRALIAEAAFAVLRRKNEFSQFAASGSGPQARRLALLGLVSALSEGGLGSGNRLESALADLAFVLQTDEFEWLQRYGQVDRNALAPMIKNNLPEWLWNELTQSLGKEQCEQLAETLMKPAPLDLRVNTMKINRDDLLAQMNASTNRFEAIPTPYSLDGIRIFGKPSLQTSTWFKDGLFEVQDEGSQILCHLLAPKRGEMVVDFCAGAGGKTLALGAMMRSTGRLYAFDTSERRLANLKPRLARSGLSNVHPVWIDSENDPKIKRLAGKIDRVLVDAPCSGLGTIRRNPDLKWRQTPEEIKKLGQTQLAILESAGRLVKPGGRLVYATCSLLYQENQGLVELFLEKHPEFEVLPAAEALDQHFLHDGISLGSSNAKPWWQVWPHIHGTDGFFGAVLRRKP